MYILKSELNTLPFAIIKNISNSNDIKGIQTAIIEEFSLVRIMLTCIKLPDWGTGETFSFTGFDENDTVISGEITITKVAAY